MHEVGPSVQSLQAGDRVMVPFNIFCGSCWFCARGLYGNCHNTNPNATAVGAIYGYSHTTGGYDGGQAEFVRVPFADVGPTRIPDWMDDEDAVMLTDALPTGYFGDRLGRGRADSKHQWMDPLIVTTPWVLRAGVAYFAVKGWRARRD